MTTPHLPDTPVAPKLRRVHLTRLRQIYRSAGWPCHDPIEIDLLAAGCLALLRDDQGRETLRPTPEGLQALAQARQQNQAALDAHEALVQKVALQQHREGRFAWTDLSLRVRIGGGSGPGSGQTDTAPPDTEPTANNVPPDGVTPCLLGDNAHHPSGTAHEGKWVMARPDVFSVRHTTVEAYLAPVVHEIKVSRADLMGDLCNPAKREAYLGLAQRVYYVLAAGIARPDEVPTSCGVIVEQADCDDGKLLQVRPAPARAFTPLPFAMWMALARATPVGPQMPPNDEPTQLGL